MRHQSRRCKRQAGLEASGKEKVPKEWLSVLQLGRNEKREKMEVKLFCFATRRSLMTSGDREVKDRDDCHYPDDCLATKCMQKQSGGKNK